MILGLCERFHCLPWPGSLLEQPADLLRMIEIRDLGTPEEVDDVGGE